MTIKISKKNKIKTLAALMTLIMATMALTACSAETEVAQSSEVEIVNVAKLSEDIGAPIKLPANIEEINCYILDESIGKMEFTIEGVEYTSYVENTLEEQNLYEAVNGAAGAFTVTETGLSGETTYSLLTSIDDINVMIWFDEVDEVAYTLYAEGDVDKDTLLEAGKEIIVSQQIN